MGFLTPDTPTPRSYPGETRKTLKAQIEMAPELYQANEIFQPLYNSLNLQNIDQFLNGTEDQTYDTYAWQKARKVGGGGGDSLLDTAFNLSPGSPGNFDLFGGGLFGGDDGGRTIPGRYVKNGTATRQGQRGFLSILQNDINPALERLQSSQRAADINDVSTLGPQMREALRRANPDAASLLDTLFSQAQGDLGAGAELTPAQARLLRQSVRGGQADRGMGFGNADAFEEALKSLDYGRGLQRERRSFAEDILGREQSFYGDPFQAVLGRSSSSAAQALGGQAGAMSKVGQLFNPESQMAQDINNTNFNSSAAAKIAGSNNEMALISGIISSLGSAGGGAMSMI